MIDDVSDTRFWQHLEFFKWALFSNDVDYIGRGISVFAGEPFSEKTGKRKPVKIGDDEPVTQEVKVAPIVINFCPEGKTADQILSIFEEAGKANKVPARFIPEYRASQEALNL